MKMFLLLCLVAAVAVADDEMCGVCKKVIQYLDSLLEDNATITEIEQALDKVCNYVADNIQEECVDIVDEHGLVIQMIAQLTDPQEICTRIGLCSW